MVTRTIGMETKIAAAWFACGGCLVEALTWTVGQAYRSFAEAQSLLEAVLRIAEVHARVEQLPSDPCRPLHLVGAASSLCEPAAQELLALPGCMPWEQKSAV